MSNRYLVRHIDGNQLSFMKRMVGEKKGSAQICILVNGETNEHTVAITEVTVEQFRELQALVKRNVVGAWIDYEANLEGLPNPAWVASAGREGAALKALAADWLSDLLMRNATRQ